MDTIISILNILPYKIIDKNKISYYLNISKCYKGYIVRYWNFEDKIIIKQQDNKLVNALKKTGIAIDILTEQGEIK
jgi:predicted AAA+ superfamily ATPase